MSERKITARCDCGSVFRVTMKHVGKKIACPNCGNPIALPAAKEPPPIRRPRTDNDVADDSFDEPSRQFSPRDRSTRSLKKMKSGWSTGTIVLTILGGGLFLLLAVCGGLVYVGFGELKNSTVYEDQPDFGEPEDLFPIEKIPVPSFSNAKISRERDLLGLGRRHEVTLVSNAEKNAGFDMRMRVVVPTGDHAAKSLPVVFVAPAGTNLMVGNKLDPSDYQDETLPYVKAGMIAVSYSLDGECDMESMTDQQLRDGYLKFRAACAGVVNARNAMEYVLANVPEADAGRLFSAGHSSAGNVSLLFAVHEPRITACVAYCPAADVEKELTEVLSTPTAGLLLPQLAEFLKQSSPKTHIAKFRCPVYLLHSRQDMATHFSATSEFANGMRGAGVDVTYVEVPSGDHYSSMTNGIPAAIDWLKQQN